jgi:hypothetical protein
LRLAREDYPGCGRRGEIGSLSISLPNGLGISSFRFTQRGRPRMKLNGRNYFGARMKYDSFEQHSVDFFIKFGFAVINNGINFVGNLLSLCCEN